MKYPPLFAKKKTITVFTNRCCGSTKKKRKNHRYNRLWSIADDTPCICLHKKPPMWHDDVLQRRRLWNLYDQIFREIRFHVTRRDTRLERVRPVCSYTDEYCKRVCSYRLKSPRKLYGYRMFKTMVFPLYHTPATLRGFLPRSTTPKSVREGT